MTTYVCACTYNIVEIRIKIKRARFEVSVNSTRAELWSTPLFPWWPIKNANYSHRDGFTGKTLQCRHRRCSGGTRELTVLENRFQHRPKCEFPTGGGGDAKLGFRFWSQHGDDRGRIPGTFGAATWCEEGRKQFRGLGPDRRTDGFKRSKFTGLFEKQSKTHLLAIPTAVRTLFYGKYHYFTNSITALLNHAM